LYNHLTLSDRKKLIKKTPVSPEAVLTKYEQKGKIQEVAIDYASKLGLNISIDTYTPLNKMNLLGVYLKALFLAKACTAKI